MMRLFFLIVFFMGMTAGCMASEATSDGYPVADQASERIPPACILGNTCVCKSYPPGPGDLLIYAYHKTRPLLSKIRAYLSTVCHWFTFGRKEKILTAFKDAIHDAK